MVAHAFNPSTREAEAGASLGVRDQPGLQELVPGWSPKLQRKPVSKNKNKNKQTNKKRLQAIQRVQDYCLRPIVLFSVHASLITKELLTQTQINLNVSMSE